MNPPLENCPDVEDCISDPSEIGHVCTYGPICGTCIVYRVIETRRGLLLGTCRIRTDRGEFPCTAPICDSYVPRAGALDARGRDRKSTRLNSSHLVISYAVFCLKKKKQNNAI